MDQRRCSFRLCSRAEVSEVVAKLLLPNSLFGDEGVRQSGLDEALGTKRTFDPEHGNFLGAGVEVTEVAML